MEKSPLNGKTHQAVFMLTQTHHAPSEEIIIAASSRTPGATLATGTRPTRGAAKLAGVRHAHSAVSAQRLPAGKITRLGATGHQQPR